MVSDKPSWLPDVLQTVLDHIGMSGETLIAMTVAQRVELWKRFGFSDEVGALAESAVSDAPLELKSHEGLSALKERAAKVLSDPLPEGYAPLAVEITVTAEAKKMTVAAPDPVDTETVKKEKPANRFALTPYEPPKRTELEEQHVGILNQGGTCYLNSTVQVLFHIPKFREIIYNIRVEDNAAKEFASITVALQNLFLALQTKKSSISTVELTQSFGWNVSDAHEQHDAHEMIQRLLEAFEMITKDTPAKEELHELFYGKQLNYVHCLDDGYVSRNPAEFFDLELLTLNNANMIASLEAKVRPEKLDGEYKREYEDGREPTKHQAEMGSIFLKLPPVLFVHPSRVDFCYQTFQRKMVDTEWRFDKEVNFSRFVAKNSEEGLAPVNDGTGEDDPDLAYELLSVIMHQGTPFSGHYMAYIRIGDKWLKFNDSMVTEVAEETVLNDGYSVPTTTTDYWGGTSTRPAHTRASVLVYIKSSLKDSLVFPITDDKLPESLHDNMRIKARREEEEKKEAEIRARRVAVRYVVADKKGDYVSVLSTFTGREGPADKAEMDKDVTGYELGARIAEAAGIDVDAIANLWQFPEYYYASSYSAPKPVASDATAADCAKGWLVVQLKDTAPQVAAEVKPAEVADDEAAPPMNREDTQEADIVGLHDAPQENVAPKSTRPSYSELPALLPLLVYRKGALEYAGLCSSVAEVADTLTKLEPTVFTEAHLESATKKKREALQPIRARRYGALDDDLYGDAESKKEASSSSDEPITLNLEDKYAFCYVEKNELKNLQFKGCYSGHILVAYPNHFSTSTIANAYDRLCNPLNVTVFQLDDALTPEEICEIVVCPSYTYQQLQDVVFEAMQGASVPLLAPIRRMPKTRDQIGFRCHDDKTDRPHKAMHLSRKYSYGHEMHTAQSILSNKGQYMITKLYVEVLPECISVPELDDHGRVCDIPLHLGYFYHRHFYMKEARNIPLYEVFRVCMAQQQQQLSAEFKDRVEARWIASKDAYLANKVALVEDPQLDMICKLPTFDPVFRLVRMSYNGTSVAAEFYDWSESITIDSYYDYVVDLLPIDIVKVNWTKYVKVEPYVKPVAFIEPEAIPTPSSEDVQEVEVVENADDEKKNEAPAAEVPPVSALAVEGDAIVKDSEVPHASDTEEAPKEPSADAVIEEAKPQAPLLLIEGPKAKPSDSSDEVGMGRVSSTQETIPGESTLYWYQLFHGDRRYTDAIYGLVTTVVLPVDETLTGSQILDLILKQIGVQPEDERFPECGDGDLASAPPSAISSPSTAAPKPLDAYQAAKKSWKVVFKGKQTKVLEPNDPYSKITADVGLVDYIMLDHPQSTKARVIPRYQRAEQAIRIGIIQSETEKMKKKKEENAKDTK